MNYKNNRNDNLGETGSSCIQGQVVTDAFYENSTHTELPSTVVGWKSTDTLSNIRELTR